MRKDFTPLVLPVATLLMFFAALIGDLQAGALWGMNFKALVVVAILYIAYSILHRCLLSSFKNQGE
jgi:hypothetical protein